MAPAATIAIRPARLDELDVMVGIDEDAGALFETAGIRFDLGPTHPYSRAERECWARAARAGDVLFAEEPGRGTVGLLVMTRVEGAPRIEQLSVRTAAMRRGIGRALLRRAIAWAGSEPLWLETYAHLPWNRPFYERAGFVVVPDRACPVGIVEILDEQRRWFPAPHQRVAMRREPAG